MKLLYVLRVPFMLKALSRGVPAAENKAAMGDSSAFGTIRSTYAPRQVQFALKLTF